MNVHLDPCLLHISTDLNTRENRSGHRGHMINILSCITTSKLRTAFFRVLGRVHMFQEAISSAASRNLFQDEVSSLTCAQSTSASILLSSALQSCGKRSLRLSATLCMNFLGASLVGVLFSSRCLS